MTCPRGVLAKSLYRSDAKLAGIRIGEQRRRPDAAETQTWCMTAGAAEAFYEGIRIGRRRAAHLQQLGLAGVA